MSLATGIRGARLILWWRPADRGVRNVCACGARSHDSVGSRRSASATSGTSFDTATWSRTNIPSQRLRPSLSSNTAHWHRLDRKYKVFKLDSKGKVDETELFLTNVQQRFGVHMRDMVSLGLQQAKEYTPPPVILPRKDVIVIGLGNFKALIHCDTCHVFEADTPAVQQAVRSLSCRMKEEIMEQGQNQDHPGFLSQPREQVPYELAMLEAMLQETCDMYRRWVSIIRKLVKSNLQEVQTKPTTGGRMEFYKLVPIRVELKRFHQTVAQCMSCLKDLLHNDEDMVGLMLSYKRELGDRPVEIARHEVVELLLENYHRQLSMTLDDISGLMQEVQFMQELASVNLDVFRNKMLWLEARLAALNVGVATSACIFSAFGMNLLHGLENESGVFRTVCMTGGGVAMLGVGAFYIYSRVFLMRTLAQESQTGGLQTLTNVYSNIWALDNVMRSCLDLDKSRLACAMTAQTDRQFAKEELDLLFQLFDTSKDGVIQKDEYETVIDSHDKSPPTEDGLPVPPPIMAGTHRQDAPPEGSSTPPVSNSPPR